MNILAIETSCDETAASVVRDGRTVLSGAVFSQIDVHRQYGGVVPEIASRCHTERIVGITKEALENSGLSLSGLDAIAVTAYPGLVGSLLVGVNYAKGLSFATGLPLIPVHHIRGHIAANYIEYKELEPPFLSLVVSGGHSHIIEVLDYTKFKIIGRTRDDAAGEAFDKAARAMGLGYPGGVWLDKAAQSGTLKAYNLPRPNVSDSEYDMSFSGLKTAVINILHNAAQKNNPVNIPDLAAEFQHAVCDTLTKRLMLAASRLGYSTIAVAGGVAANSGLRAALESECNYRGYKLFIPSIPLCGDNAAMIGAQAYYEFLSGNVAGLDLNAQSSAVV